MRARNGLDHTRLAKNEPAIPAQAGTQRLYPPRQSAKGAARLKNHRHWVPAWAWMTVSGYSSHIEQTSRAQRNDTPQPSSISSTAMRMATPLLTWRSTSDCGPSATSSVISTPRLIGPGCSTTASFAARARRMAVSP